jgi:hypothetical protein
MREDAEFPRPTPDATSPRSLSLLIYLVIFGIAMLIVGGVVVHELRRVLPHIVLVRPPDRIFMLLVLGTGSGLVILRYGFVVIQRRRLVETTPTSMIRSLAMGLVEVTGRVEIPDAVLTAPFSNLPCVFFSYKVEEQRGSGNRRRWETITEGRSPEPFSLRDATGSISVFPDGAEVILHDARTYRNDWLGRLPANVTEGLARLGISTRGWLGSRTFRCRESCLLPGASVYVLGTAQENTRKSVPGPVISHDQNRDFIISDRSEKELVAEWSWQAYALVYGGPALTIGCLLALLHWYLRTN